MLLDQRKAQKEEEEKPRRIQDYEPVIEPCEPYHLINIMISGFKNNQPCGVCELILFKAEESQDAIPFKENKYELFLGDEKKDQDKQLMKEQICQQPKALLKL